VANPVELILAKPAEELQVTASVTFPVVPFA